MRQLYFPIKVCTTLFRFYSAAFFILFLISYSVLCFLLYPLCSYFDYKYLSWFYNRKFKSLSIRCDFTINVHKYYYLFSFVLRSYSSFSNNSSYYFLFCFLSNRDDIRDYVWESGHLDDWFIIFYYRNILS